MRRLAVLLAACAAAACSDPERDPPVVPPAGPRTATPLADGGPLPVTSFAQTVPDLCGARCQLGEVFPGQANTWVVDRDFSLAEGWGLQYGSALELFVGAPSALTHDALLVDTSSGVLEPFPWDQDASEVVFLTPRFGAADGVRTAAASDGVAMGVPALSGARSAFLNGTSDSRLSRTLALAAGEQYTIAWKEAVYLAEGLLVGATTGVHASSFRVVARGASQEVDLSARALEVASGSYEATFTAPAAEVELSFDLRSAAGGYAVVDDVALAGQDGPIPLDNGDFEGEPLAPWVANGGAESQNVRSGARALAAGGGTLTVTRTFYAQPSATWARVVDVFENPGTQPVTTDAVYRTVAAGSSRFAVTRPGGGIVAWDGDGLVRDFALVAGTGQPVVDHADGSVLFAVHALTVPPGGKVALAHFVVQLGSAEGGYGTAATDVPPATAAEVDAIVAGFPADEPYTLDLEPGVLDAIANF